MELFNLQPTPTLSLGKKVSPSAFKEILPEGALEQDLEDLIVNHPALLNWADIDRIESPPDLLVISRQPRTQTRKRADLFAVTTDGELVVIEIKRDAQDERARREAMEFQAIRYAAASRKMSPSAITDMFAIYLKSLADTSKRSTAGLPYDYRAQAVSLLCKHLADEDEELTEADLEERLDPKTKQKIYLVAAGYEPDVLSACAWLREHEINIACFRLRPYRVAGQWLMERERLIPPPELDEFFVEMGAPGEVIAKVTGAGPRRKQDRPLLMKWADDSENKQAVSTWKEALIEGVNKAMVLGLTPANLPMQQSDKGDGLRSPQEVTGGLQIETHASAELIRQWLSKMLKDRGKPKGFLQIVTRSGMTIDLPE
jgi:hypothetical protein